MGTVRAEREALLARAVLRGATRGYRSHPQLQRFRECPAPLSAINAYLATVHAEAVARGYGFDRSKLARAVQELQLGATRRQLMYEWDWLLRKLARRNPALYRRHRALQVPDPHPLFRLSAGPIAPWERQLDRAAVRPSRRMPRI